MQRHPFQLEWVINQSFEIHRPQLLLFALDSFDYLFEEVERLEDWMLSGRLASTAAGEPSVSQTDLLASFLDRDQAPGATG